jgi:hypothetical protein
MQILIVNALSKGHIRGYRTPVDQTPLTPELREVIIGVLLGDCHAQKRCPNSNVSLLFSLGGNNIEYGHHLYTLFKNYCLSAPKVSLQSNKQSGKMIGCDSLHVQSLSLMNTIRYSIGRVVKSYLQIYIMELLTARGLACLLGYGRWGETLLRLHTLYRVLSSLRGSTTSQGSQREL